MATLDLLLDQLLDDDDIRVRVRDVRRDTTQVPAQRYRTAAIRDSQSAEDFRAHDATTGIVRMIMSAISLLEEFGVEATFAGFNESGEPTIWLNASNGSLTAGEGDVTLNKDGLSLVGRQSYATKNAVTWYDAASLTSLLTKIYTDYYVDGDGRHIRLNFIIDNSADKAEILIKASGTGSDKIGLDADKVELVSSGLTLPEISSPATPASGKGVIYQDAIGQARTKNDDGIERILVPSHLQLRSYISDWMLGQAEDGWSEIAIGAGSGANIENESNHPGIIRIAQSGANTGYQLRLSSTGYLLGGGEVVSFIFRPQSVTAVVFHMGFRDNLGTGAPVDGAYISVDGSTLTGKTVSNSAGSTTGTSYTVSTGTWYRCVVAINADATRVDFYLYDASGNQLWTNNLTTNIPNASGRNTQVAGVFYKTSTGTVNLIDVDWCAYWNNTILVR